MAAQKATPGFGSGVVQKLEAIMDDPNFENPKECTGSSVVTMGEKGKYRCVNVSQGGVPKPENGQCPRCLASAYTGKPNETRSLGGVWEIREFAKDRRAMVECTHCRTIFAVTVTNWG